MKFEELESFMKSRGYATLAEISRALSTTPQAVSNWKARDQVPYHIAAKLNINIQLQNDKKDLDRRFNFSNVYEEDTISFFDLAFNLAEQTKVIALTLFTIVFLTFTYVQFIEDPQYISSAKILLPENKQSNLGGLAGLANQFGVEIPSNSQADLSSPLLIPELIRSRTFAERILSKKFYTEKFNKELTLLSILTHGLEAPSFKKDTLITKAMNPLSEILTFNQDPLKAISVLQVKTFEPLFSKDLSEIVLQELESLNNQFKTKTINDKISFISSRISSVEIALEKSELDLKKFNEQNRQISSPSLQLLLDRLTREVEIQKGIYLTLKQQLELAKIEEVQLTPVLQILDYPKIPLGPSNKNIKRSMSIAIFVGAIFGVLLGLIRSFLLNASNEEKRKFSKSKDSFIKKIKGIAFDKRITGSISLLLVSGLPFYLGGESQEPVFFGRYSLKLLMLNIAYLATLFLTVFLYLYSKIKLK